MNSTAYRIFKLLSWLMEEPLDVPSLNRRFAHDPLIGKEMSSDSILLYINTLKALGCVIGRPSPRNGFCYELLYHPFGMLLREVDLDTLARLKGFGQQVLSHDDMLVLDRLIKRILKRSSTGCPDELIARLFSESRSLDYEAHRHHIEALHDAIDRADLVRLIYESPTRGERDILFLPESLCYEQGVLYVTGDQPDYDDLSRLRVDRIHGVEPVQEPAVRQALINRRAQVPHVVLRLWAEQMDDLAVVVPDGAAVQTRLVEPGCWEVSWPTRDFFTLRQRLLSSGMRFGVLAPRAFRQEMQATLEAMLAGYETEVPDGRG